MLSVHYLELMVKRLLIVSSIVSYDTSGSLEKLNQRLSVLEAEVLVLAQEPVGQFMDLE